MMAAAAPHLMGLLMENLYMLQDRTPAALSVKINTLPYYYCWYRYNYCSY